MDLPTVCPYCDSERVTYRYRPAIGAVGVGAMVFSCADCGSHVESSVTSLDAPRDDPRWIAPAVPTQRLQSDAELDDHR